MINIIFNESVGSYFSKDSRILLFPFNLSTKSGVLSKERLAEVEVGIYRKDITYLKNAYQKFFETDFNDSEITIWYSDESNELCNFLYLVNYLSEFQATIYSINCSDRIYIGDVGVENHNTAELSEEYFEVRKNTKRVITNVEIKFFKDLYEQSYENNESQKIWKNSRLIHISFSTIDSLIRDIIRNGYSNKADIIFYLDMILELNIPEAILMSRLEMID